MGERHGHGRIHHGYHYLLVFTFLNHSSVGIGIVSQLRVELARGTALLALTSITSSVATLTVATVTTTATASEGTAALLVTEHATGGSVGSLLLDVGSGNDLGGKVEPLSEVVETLGSQGVVVYVHEKRNQFHVPCDGVVSQRYNTLIGGSPTVLPRELSLDETTGVQGLHGLDDVEILDRDLGVLLEVEAEQSKLSVEALGLDKIPCDPYSF